MKLMKVYVNHHQVVHSMVMQNIENVIDLEIRKNAFKEQRDLDAMENDTTAKNIG